MLLGNLEGPVLSADHSQSHLPAKAGPRIHSTSLVLGSLVDTAEVVTLSIANNHGYDYGDAGIRSTEEECRKHSVNLLGLDDRVMVDSCPKIAVFAMTEPCFGTPITGGPLTMFSERLYHQICTFKEDGYVVVVLVHGGSEDVFLVDPRSTSRYRTLCDFGADVVWGTHSHVPQVVERYKSSLICYGAGNALVDTTRWNENRFGQISRSLVITVDQHVVASEVQTLECVSRGNSLLLREVEDKRLLDDLQTLDDAMLALMDDPTLHRQVWQKYARRFAKNYGNRAFLLGTFIDLIQPIVGKIEKSKFVYPLSVDNLLWPTNKSLHEEATVLKYFEKELMSKEKTEVSKLEELLCAFS